jgi:putative oxidoreductase
MLLNSLNRFRDCGLLLMRVGVGVVFIFHGYPKLRDGPQTWTFLATGVGLTFAPAFWGFMAAFAEAVGGLLLAIGLLTRVAALLLVFDMAGALTFHFRHHDSFGTYSHALEMLFVFAGLFLIGPGRHSVDECCCGGECSPRSHEGTKDSP